MIHTDFGFMGEEESAELLFIILLFSPSLKTFPLHHIQNKESANMMQQKKCESMRAVTVKCYYPSARLSFSRFRFISAFLASNSSLPGIIGRWTFIRFPISARSLLKSNTNTPLYIYINLLAITKKKHYKQSMSTCEVVVC